MSVLLVSMGAEPEQANYFCREARRASSPRKLWLQDSFDLDMKQAWPVIARMPALTQLSLADGRFTSWPSRVLTAPPSLVDLEIARAELPTRVAKAMRAWPGVTVRE